MKRALITAVATVALTIGAVSLPARAVGDVQIALSCSDGNDVTLQVDQQTLLDLTSAVAALSGSGLDCTITQQPTLLSFFVTPSAASNGSKDFAVGGGQYLASSVECGGAFTVNIGFSAHVDSSGLQPETAKGSLSETISQPGGICNGDRFKVSITCLQVLTDTAWMDGPVTQATGAFAFGVPNVLTGAATVSDGPDLYNDTRNRVNCPVATIAPAVPFIHGNIVVKDR